MSNVNTIERSSYGEIISIAGDRRHALIQGARDMAAQAATRKRIPRAFDDSRWERISSRIGNKRVGDALHHEVYDVTPDGRTALICVRATEGDRYGVKTVSKDYYLLTRHGKGIRVTEAPKAKAAKAAKQAGSELGQAIEVCQGKAKLSSPTAPARTGYVGAV